MLDLTRTDDETLNLRLLIEEQDQSRGLKVILSGALTVKTPATAWAGLDNKWRGKEVVFDLKQLTALDLNGAAQLITIMDQAVQAGLKASVQDLPEKLVPIFKLASDALEKPVVPPAACDSVMVELGRTVVGVKNDLVVLTTFAGELVWEFVRSLRHPRSIPWAEVMKVGETSGVNAVPIVALVSFLVGLIIAFQSAMVLKLMGMEIYVANMVGIAVVRELGPLIAAIVLAGRSGSAFSAELGAMKVAEEVDAITTMGLSPVRELALPRVLASVLTTPLVTLIGSFMGIFGGSLVLLALGYSMMTFWTEAISMISIETYYISIFKSFLFGFCIAAIGCQRGLAAGDGPGAVGQATTSGVVANIVAITVLDSLLAVLFYAYDV